MNREEERGRNGAETSSGGADEARRNVGEAQADAEEGRGSRRRSWDESDRESIGEREPKDREPDGKRDSNRETDDEKRSGHESGEGSKERRDRVRRRERGHSYPAVFSLSIGFFAGIFWGLARWFAVSLNFTKVPQAFLVDAWVKRSTLHSAGWHWIGLLLFVVMSVVAAMLYWLLLGRLHGPWPGLFFGAAWWAMLFLVVGPPTGTTEPVRTLGWNSIFTELCLYLIWGLFIGYSYAFEFHDESAREPKGSSGKRGGPQPAH
nr:YqhR family membrane protein [Cohnella zeiphila]